MGNEFNPDKEKIEVERLKIEENIEVERLKINAARFKTIGNIIIVLISVGIGTFGVAYINHTIQNKRLEGEIRKEEMQSLGKFIDYAMTNEREQRLMFAEYFATLTVSPEMQKRWRRYYQKLVYDYRKKFEYEVQNKSLTTTKGGDAETDEKKLGDLKVKESLLNVKLALMSKVELAPLQKEFLTEDKIKVMITKNRFYDENWNPNGSTSSKNFDLASGKKVVYEKDFDLRWQQSGSSETMNYEEAKQHVDKLNREIFAGYSGWRLPTVEEAMRLIDKTKTNGGLYIDPKFDNKQDVIWTSGLANDSEAWAVDFKAGYRLRNRQMPRYDCFVRAVR